MPPPYEAYQQAGYGQYPAYGQAQMQQFDVQGMVAPSVSSPLVQQNQQNHQAQWQNANINYNYQQQYVPPQQQQNFQFPPQQTAQFQQTPQYQHSSPLQQFAAGQLQESRQQQPQQQQQYWPQSAQGVNYSTQYQPSQRQTQSTQLNGQSYLPAQHDTRQAIASSSPVQSHQVHTNQGGYAAANQQRHQHSAFPSQHQVLSHPRQQIPPHVQQTQVTGHSQRPQSVSLRPQQQNSQPSPSQHFQATPNQQTQSIASQQVSRPSPSQQNRATPISQRSHSVSSRSQQVNPASNQRLPQPQHQNQPQRTPSQSYNQGRSHQVQQSNGTPQQHLSKQPAQTPQRTSQSGHTPQSTPNSRVLTHVEIPAHRPLDMAAGPTPQRSSAKRKNSYDSDTIVVSQRHDSDTIVVSQRQPQKQQPPVPAPKPYVAIPKYPESSPLSELVSSQVVPPTPSPEVDYQSVLLSLSEEYVNAAHTMSAHLCSPDATEELFSQYHKLIATALGCLESLITTFRLRDARKEARVRLRFANLLFEETEDTIATEESLSKGITFCERNRLTDTKYAMHHLLVRVMHKTNATAAIRSLEKLIQEVETMGLTPWIYAFRFLRVSLSAHSGGPSDTSAVLRHLAALNDHADAHQHIGVQITASTLDAIVHLQSGDSMAADLASRSLAAARTHQTAPVMDEIPQLRAAIDILDLACAFMQSTPPDQTTQKMVQFHQSLDARAKNTGWTADGSFSLPLGLRSSSDVEADTGGVFRTTPSGELALAFMWLSRSQLYMIGFMLGGISMMSKNGEDRKSETFLTEGLKLNASAVDASAMSIKATEALIDMQQEIAIAIKLLQIFAYCGRAGWTTALKAIEALNADLVRTPQYCDEYTTCSLLYLTGMCKQALGDEAGALRLYQSTELSLQPNPHKAVTAVKDIQALAALNSVSIMRFQNKFLQQDPAMPERLLADLEPYCENNHNKAIVSTWHILRAHDPDPSTSIIKIKQCIQAALRPAQAIKNVRIMAIIMNTMTAQFFDGIMGKQALQSASAGKSLARRSQDSLWVSVGDGIYRDALVRGGDVAAALQAEKQVEMVLAKVPSGVKSKLSL